MQRMLRFAAIVEEMTAENFRKSMSCGCEQHREASNNTKKRTKITVCLEAALFIQKSVKSLLKEIHLAMLEYLMTKRERNGLLK